MLVQEMTNGWGGCLEAAMLLGIFLVITASCGVTMAPPGMADYRDLDTVADFLPRFWLPQNTYKGSFDEDYKNFYFFRKLAPDDEKYLPYASRYVDGRWEEPQIMDFYKPQYSYTYPLKFPGSSKLLFLSNMRMDSDTSTQPNYNFWLVDILQDSTSIPREFGYKNLMYNYNSQPCISADGTLYFTSDLPDWSSTYAFKMEYDGHKYVEPEPFDPVNQWREKEHWIVYEYCIAPDESYLIVCLQNNEDPQPSADLFLSKKRDNMWSDPQRLPDWINTIDTENFPVITQDGQYLIFTRAFSQFKIVPIAKLMEEYTNCP